MKTSCIAILHCIMTTQLLDTVYPLYQLCHIPLGLRYENVTLIIHWHNRYYSKEKRKALDYPDWLSPTCTYRLFLIFNQLLSSEMTTTITGTCWLHIRTYAHVCTVGRLFGGLQISRISWIWGLPQKLFSRKLADILLWHGLQTEEKTLM